MPDIFISYRREDSSGHAGRLFDCIRERFGDESVFMDVTDISPGDDFTVALDGALASCRVVLVLIGPHWLTSTSSDGGRRLDDPGDHLRMEVAHALQRNARVIPVLVRGATMPQERDLPDGLHALARRQAHEVSDSRWSFDTDQLVRIIEQALGMPPRHADSEAPSHVTEHAARHALKGVPYNTGDAERRHDSTGVGDGLPPSREATADRRSLGGGGQAVPSVARGRSIRIVAPATIFVVLIALTAYMKWFGAGGPRDGAVVTDPSRGAGGASGRSSAATPPARLPEGGEARAGAAIFKLLGGLVSRGDEGPQTVRLFVRTTNVGARYGMNISHDSFRLLVGDQAIAPQEAPIEVVSMQSATEGWVAFQVPASAADVALQVGNVREATARIPIDLRPAGSLAAEKPPPTWRVPTDIAVTFERRAGAVVFTIDGARIEHYGDAVPPLQPEKLLLTIKVRLKNAGRQYGYALGGDEFRLIVDDVPLAPTKSPTEVLAYQADLRSEVVFIIPGTATKTVLQLGDLDASPVRVPLDLSAARRQP